MGPHQELAVADQQRSLTAMIGSVNMSIPRELNGVAAETETTTNGADCRRASGASVNHFVLGSSLARNSQSCSLFPCPGGKGTIMANEITVGIAGAAGDGLDRTGESLARTAARLGLHLFTYNSYQSLIRGGHTWLRLRLSEDKVDNHGDHLNVLIALNQDSLERHAGEVEPGGAIIFNVARFNCDPSLVREGVSLVPLPVPKLTESLGKIPPVMQNTVALGALLRLIGFDIEVMIEILSETFKKKGAEVIAQNAGALRAGYDFA